MNHRLLTQMFLMWLFTGSLFQLSLSTRNRVKQQSFQCPTPCSQPQRVRHFYGDTCSCTKSCLLYGDCCRDAPYQNTGSENVNHKCVTLSGLGPVLLVSRCPSPSDATVAMSEDCYTGLERTFPVTSKDTGTSYSNYFYALCNNDTSNLVGWPVRLRCGVEEQKTVEEISVKNFLKHHRKDNRLESLSVYNYDYKQLRDCKLYAENNDFTFAKSLELRTCVRGEISQCWPDWEKQTTRQLCGSYLDPVRSGNRFYRNKHCAQCNGKDSWEPKCLIQASRKSASPADFSETVKCVNCIADERECPRGQVRHPSINVCVNIHKSK